LIAVAADEGACAPVARGGAPSSRVAGLLARWAEHPLPLLLALALLLRLASVQLYSFHHPDEIYQYLEQAHRIATGYGVVPWEYRANVRNWLIPLLLSWPIWLSDQLGLSEPAYIPLIRGLLATASLSVVASFYHIGRRISGTHAIVAGFVGAVWFEFVYFASHPLSESLSLALFAPAAALLFRSEKKPAKSLIMAGLLLGFAVLMRYQIVAAAGVLALVTCGLRLRVAWTPLIVGGVMALGVGALVDLATGIVPYTWVVNNFRINITEGRAAFYGVEGPAYYPKTIFYIWQTSTLPILLLASFGVRRYPALLLAAGAHLFAHLLIGHKEYRFILMTTALVILLASLGSADLLRWAQQQMKTQSKRVLFATVLGLWLATSLALAVGDRFRFQWTAGNPALRMTQAAGEVPRLCGLATLDVFFAEFGGYSYLHRQVPIYPLETRSGGLEVLRRSTTPFNAILARSRAGPKLPASFKPYRCQRQIGALPPYDGRRPEDVTACVYVRPGPCAPAQDVAPINKWLVQNGH